MKRRLITLMALIVATIALTIPARPQSTCDKADKYCWDNSELVVGYCMIVHEDPNYCSNAGADYYENCMAERNCTPRDH